MAIAICNYPASIEDGHSTLFNTDSSIELRAGTEEGISIAKCDLDARRDYREKTMAGFVFS